MHWMWNSSAWMWKDVLNKRLGLLNHLWLYYHPTLSNIYTLFYSLSSCLSKWPEIEKCPYLFIGHLLYCLHAKPKQS